jgi:hypothetical protein
MCIHLVGDSNTKCTHLGGVHTMVWLWDKHCFKLILCSPLAMCFGAVLHSKRIIFHSQCDLTSLKECHAIESCPCELMSLYKFKSNVLTHS